MSHAHTPVKMTAQPDEITAKMHLLDLSEFNCQSSAAVMSEDPSGMQAIEAGIIWHIFTMEFNPANIISRISWNTRSIRIHDGKTYSYFALKHHTDFQVKTPLAKIMSEVSCSSSSSNDYFSIELIQEYFKQSSFIVDHFNVSGAPPIDSFVILPMHRNVNALHVAILNFDYTYNSQLDSLYPNIEKHYYNIDMMDGVKTHRNITTGAAFGSTLNLFTAISANIKKKAHVIHPHFPIKNRLQTKPAPYNSTLNMEQFVYVAEPYFPELQIIWVSSSIALTPGIDTTYYRESAHMPPQQKSDGTSEYHTKLSTHRNNFIMRRQTERSLRREEAFNKLFTNTNTQPGAAPTVKQFGQLMFCLKSHAKQQASAGNQQYSHLGAQFDHMIID